MARTIEDIFKIYKREINSHRLILSVLGLATAIVTLAVAANWPKSYTATSTIYADNSNILRPLMDGNAVAPSNGQNQARMAQDILFSRNHNNAILETAGYPVDELATAQKDQLISGIQGRTTINNVGRGAARLVMISHSDADPVRAYRLVQKYTSIFIEQALLSEREESRSAFDFIEKQVLSYQLQLQASERRLSDFKSTNNFGTLGNANNRIAGYTSEIERLDLDFVQIDSQIKSVEAQLAGEITVSRNLGEINSIRSRINSLQLTLDRLRARFHDSYPDVVQIKTQIEDLQLMLQEGGRSGEYQTLEGVGDPGATSSLHQELRSLLAGLQTTMGSKISERASLVALLEVENDRARRINENEAELAELTRDYNVTQAFYNTLLGRLENARLTVNLNQEEHGITFKVQEAAVIPTQPDGFAFSQLMVMSFILMIGVPLGSMVTWIELDPRLRSDARWSDDWPPLLGVVHPLKEHIPWWRSGYVFSALFLVAIASTYGLVAYLKLTGSIN